MKLTRTHKRYDLLVPPENPEELSNAIIKTFQDKDQIKAKVVAACDFASKNFSIEPMVENYQTFYLKQYKK